VADTCDRNAGANQNWLLSDEGGTGIRNTTFIGCSSVDNDNSDGVRISGNVTFITLIGDFIKGNKTGLGANDFRGLSIIECNFEDNPAASSNADFEFGITMWNKTRDPAGLQVLDGNITVNSTNGQQHIAIQDGTTLHGGKIEGVQFRNDPTTSGYIVFRGSGSGAGTGNVDTRYCNNLTTASLIEQGVSGVTENGVGEAAIGGSSPNAANWETGSVVADRDNPGAAYVLLQAGNRTQIGTKHPRKPAMTDDMYG